MNTYAVVRFDDESVSEVPITWLTDNNKFCYWPNTKNVSVYINKAIAPDPQWKKYEVDVELFCENLELARKKSEDINYSESEELNRGRGKRSTKKNALYKSDEENISTSDEEYKSRRTLKPPPRMPVTHEHTKVISCKVSKTLTTSCSRYDSHLKGTNVQNSNSEMGSSDRTSTTDISEQFDINSLPVMFEISDGVENFNGDPLTVTESQTFLSNGPDSVKEVSQNEKAEKDDKTLKKVLEALVQLTFEVRDLKNIVLSQNHNSVNKGLKDFSAITNKFPLKDLVSLKEFENDLKNKELEGLLKEFLLTIGGSGHKENIYRIFKRMFSNELGIRCSWLGQRNNFRIVDTKCISVVKTVILETHPIQEKEFEVTSSEWFRQANQRLQRQRQK